MTGLANTVKPWISYFRRVFISRCRLKQRWSTTVFLVLLILVATVILMTRLPSSVDLKQSQEPIKINPKFSALFGSNSNKNELTLDEPAVDQLKAAQDVRDEGKPWSSHYGDRFAWFDDSMLGNFEPREIKPTGRPGDEGKEYHIENEPDVDTNEVHDLKNQYGMNIAASNRIPMDRSIPDLRLEECKNWNYGEEDLPTASVVIVFHNEGFSTLMRTVHSVLLRSPKKYLREVVLVDDYSDKDLLHEHLDEYIKKTWGDWKPDFEKSSYSLSEGRKGETIHDKSGKVKLVRNTERMGLINSRTRGAKESSGDVVVFLDAHCEVSYNWLTPLLAPIAKNPKTLTVPIIDGIDSEHFQYRPVYSRADQHFKGIWEWGMYYKELEVDMKEHLKTHKVSEPYDAPTHAGGLFAIRKDYFMTLGGYDPGLLVWGGENFELSFKVWQCGGRLQWVPCSRVGHIYRAFMPYSFGSLAKKRKGPLIITNYRRVIEVWWDKQYKEYFYTREPMARFYEYGDISAQVAIREKLQCKSFDWFMNNVGKDVYKHFPQLPPNTHWGEIKNLAVDQCLDTGSSAPPQTVHASQCHDQGGHQLFRLNARGQLGVGERCIDATKKSMTLIYCKLGSVDGPWTYNEETQQLKHNKNLCLEYLEESGAVHLSKCTDDDKQKWAWKEVRPRRG